MIQAELKKESTETPLLAETETEGERLRSRLKAHGAAFDDGHREEPIRDGLKLRLRQDGRLVLERPGQTAVTVSVQRCFPWSQPLSWLSLRDEEGNEVELLKDVDSVDPQSAKELLRALEESAFVFGVEEILSVEEEFELRQWKVRLKEGVRTFQTKLNTWPRELASGGLLIQDVANDLYLVPDLENLDPASAKILWAFLDD